MCARHFHDVAKFLATAILLIGVNSFLASSASAQFPVWPHGDDDPINDPSQLFDARDAAGDAFYASADAYSAANGRWQYWNARPWLPNSSLLSTYWKLSADYQYSAAWYSYFVWQDLQSVIDNGYVIYDSIDEEYDRLAASYALNAYYIALFCRSYDGDGAWATYFAQQSYERIQIMEENVTLLR